MTKLSSSQIRINKTQARRFLLSYQGLLPPRQLKNKEDILAFFRKVGCIQFDPLNILGRNPDLVLQSRVKDYRTDLLEELLYQDRRLLDGFDKVMSIYAVQDWPYFTRYREAQRAHLGHEKRPANGVLDEVREEIRKKGPLSSIDLKLNHKVDWAWGPTRISRAALESMYFWGELIIHHKVNTRKVYDFAENHLPAELLKAPDPNQTLEEYRAWHILRRTGSVGLINPRSGDLWLGIEDTKKAQRDHTFAELFKKGEVIQVEVEDIPNQFFFMRSGEMETLEQLDEGEISHPKAAILAALDNLTWDRRMLLDIFDFDYKWEVYKPAAERKYGYYVLPVLYGDRLVARFEAKMERKRSELVFKNWWWEANIHSADPTLQNALLDCFKQFTAYLAAEKFTLDDQYHPAADMDWLQELVR